jgi:ABC-2 type transport system permease protein
MDTIAGILSGSAATVLEQLSLTSHFDTFVRGIIDTTDIVYYLVLAGVFLFFTIRSLESRRWR